MLRAITIIVSIGCIIAAGASHDDIIPEDVLYQDYDSDLDSTELSANLEFATQSVNSLKNDGACKKLAEDIKKEVDTSVKNDQKVLDGLADAKCDTAGVAVVKAAEDQLAAREKELKDATKAKHDAQNAKVSFRAVSFGSINEKDCNQFFSQSTYVTATKTVTTTTAHESKKKGEVIAAKVAVTNAKAEASRLQAACRCRMKKAALEAFARFSKQDAGRKEAYGRGNMLLCVLAKKNVKDASCTAAGVPSLKMPKGVHQDMCVKFVSHKPTSSCSTSCGLSAVTHRGRITCVGLHGKNEPEAKCTKIGLKKPALQTLGCTATGACPRWVTRSPTGSCPSGCGKSATTLYGSVVCMRGYSTVSSGECAGQGTPAAPTRYCRPTPQCCYIEGFSDYYNRGSVQKIKVCNYHNFISTNPNIYSIRMGAGCNGMVYADNDGNSATVGSTPGWTGNTGGCYSNTYLHPHGCTYLQYKMKGDIYKVRGWPKLGC